MDFTTRAARVRRTGMIDTRPKKNHERAVLVGLEQAGVSKWDLRDSLEELAELANSAGAEVVETVTQKLQKPTAPYYIGKGKAESIKESFQDRQVTSVIFDDELSPAQGRNLETLLARTWLLRTSFLPRSIRPRAVSFCLTNNASFLPTRSGSCENCRTH